MKRGYNPFNGPDKTSLTKREKDIIKKLQNDWVFITGSDFGAQLWPPSKSLQWEKVRLDVFFSLERKGMIFQDGMRNHGYYITPLGLSQDV